LDISVVKMLEKLGVGADGVSASPSGLFGSPVLPRRESDADAERAAILYVYGRFLDVVAQGRKMDRARVDELGKGQIWLGSEAVANGLVDGIGGLDEAKAAMAELLGSDPRFIPCLPGEMDLRRLLGMGSPENGAVGKAVSGALRAADELAELDGGLLYLEPAYLYRPRAAFEDGGDFFLGGR
jgi:ClpP class serine protease